MAEVNVEVLVPEIAGGIYVKFQRNLLILWIEKAEKQGGKNVSTVRCQGERDIQDGAL